MLKPTRKLYPILSTAWDDYGHAIPFEDLVDIKVRDDLCYCVVAWEENGMINYADWARPHPNAPWDMQNDGHEPITKAEWKKARIVPDCDWMDIDRS